MAEEPDIDVGAITEALNNKTDTDVQNTTDVGSAQIAHFAMPSSSYIDVALGASGDTYTPPADGYYSLSKKSTAASQYLNMSVVTSDGSATLYTDLRQVTNTGEIAAPIPISAGNKLKVNYNLAGTTNFFHFVYAKGSEPQS